jgi:formylmethanofuran dehydrogenase subunit D
VEKLIVTLISGRTVNQGVGLEEGKMSEKYVKSVQQVQINPKDAEKLDLTNDDTVEISTKDGKVIVNWMPDLRLDQGLVFFPYGPWANQLFNSVTDGTGMPSFKGIKGTVTASDKEATSLKEILDMIKGGT